jgi:hypothetical protein
MHDPKPTYTLPPGAVGEPPGGHDIEVLAWAKVIEEIMMGLVPLGQRAAVLAVLAGIEGLTAPPIPDGNGRPARGFDENERYVFAVARELWTDVRRYMSKQYFAIAGKTTGYAHDYYPEDRARCLRALKKHRGDAILGDFAMRSEAIAVIASQLEKHTRSRPRL